MESAKELMPRLTDILEKVILDKYKDRGHTILNKVLLEMQREITTTSTASLGRSGAAGQENKYNIRYQIEQLLSSKEPTKDLIFHKVIVDGHPFVLKLHREQLNGLNIKYFGQNPALNNFDFKLVNKKAIMKRVKTLASIIRLNGRKVRLYTAIGVDSDKHGIQYISPDTSGLHYQHLDRPLGYTVLEPHYFEVDFDKGELQALRTLEKVVGLSMSFGNQPAPAVRDYLFIMKGIDQVTGEYYDWQHQGMISAFNGRRFFTYSELFSPAAKQVTTSPRYEFQRVDINYMEGMFNLKEANKDWSIFSFYIPFFAGKGINDIFNDRNSFYH